jgi:cation diffusion facilitator family transporter
MKKWQFNKYLIMEGEQRQKRMSLKYVMIGGVIVLGLKSYAYFSTWSNAILSDVAESLLNLGACTFSMYSLFFASRPRNSKYPYGHGKMEYLAASVEGFLIVLAGAFIGGKAIYNFFNPQGIVSIDQGISFEAGAAAINLFLGIYLVKRAKKLESQILNADGKRILTDAYSTIALIIALFIVLYTHYHWLDNLIAIISGGLIIRTGIKIIRQAMPGLLETADTVILEEVINVLQDNSRPEWIDIQNMRSTHYGMYIYIDCHFTMPWYWNVKDCAEQVQQAELIINQHFKQRVDLFVQVEPCRPKDCHICRVENCAVRQFPYSGKQTWKLGDVLQKGIPGF